MVFKGSIPHHETMPVEVLVLGGTASRKERSVWLHGGEYAFKSMLKVVVFHPDNKVVYRNDRVGKHVC